MRHLPSSKVDTQRILLSLMVRKHAVKYLSKPVLDVELFPYIIRELNEQEQASISGGQIQRLQEEFAVELATLAAIALPSLLNRPKRTPR